MGSPIRIETGRSGVCGKINLCHLFIKRCRGKREGAKCNSNLHRVGGCRQGAHTGSSRETETETERERLGGSVVHATDLFALARLSSWCLWGSSSAAGLLSGFSTTPFTHRQNSSSVDLEVISLMRVVLIKRVGHRPLTTRLA